MSWVASEHQDTIRKKHWSHICLLVSFANSRWGLQFSQNCSWSLEYRDLFFKSNGSSGGWTLSYQIPAELSPFPRFHHTQTPSLYFQEFPNLELLILVLEISSGSLFCSNNCRIPGHNCTMMSYRRVHKFVWRNVCMYVLYMMCLVCVFIHWILLNCALQGKDVRAVGVLVSTL